MKPKVSVDHLQQLYASGLSFSAVARQCNLTHQAVWERLHRAGVKTRPQRKPVDHFRKLYESGLSVDAVGRQYGISGAAVWMRLRKSGFTDFRPNRYPSFPGPKNWNWKGGRGRLGTGYILINIGPNRRQLEHRHIMEARLGRKLRRDEYVHHVNGIRDDNRIENLTLVSPNTHEKWTLTKILQKRIRELESEIAHL